MTSVEIAPKRFQPYRINFQIPNISVNDGVFSPTLPYEADFEPVSPNYHIKRLIVSLHGTGGDAIHYHENGRAVVEAQKKSSPQVAAETMVVAPQFIVYPNEFSGPLPGNLLYWEGGRAAGALSGNHQDNPRSYKIRSFDVMDQFLEFLSRPESLPNLEIIILIGQSNGGRFLNRYAAASPFEDRVARPRGVHVRYIVMGSGSYVYMNNQRWQFTSEAYLNAASSGAWRNDVVPVQDIEDICDDPSGYNNWPWGLQSLWNYPYQLRAARIHEQYKSRDVIYLVGEEDLSESYDFCAEYSQGPNTLAKTLLYFYHLQDTYGAALQHRMRVVKDVTHNGKDTMTSPEGLEEIFRPIPQEVIMRTFADYVVIRDTSVKLEMGKTKSYTFNLPTDVMVSSSNTRPIVAFVADPSKAKNLDFRVTLNNSEVLKTNYSGEVRRGQWEVINHIYLKPGEENTMQLSVLNGSGAVYISDIVLWFQRKV